MKHSIQIPFCGFYESAASSIIDDAFNDAFYYNDCGDYAVPDEAWFKLDCSEARRELVTEYLDAWQEVFKDKTGISLAGKFDGMESPREYNFTTDRIFIEVSGDVVQALWAESVANGHKQLAEVLLARHTSYDGFWSHYSNNLDTWLEKPVTEWDHNELESLLIAVLCIHCPDWDEDSDFEVWNLLEHWQGNGGASDAIWSAMPEEMQAFAELQREAGEPCSYELYIATGKPYPEDYTMLDVEQETGEPIYIRCKHTLELPLQ